MLIGFCVCNFRSFREAAELSLKACPFNEHPENVQAVANGMSILKSVAIFGANAAGKSNLIKAMSAALLIIRTSQTRQIGDRIPFVEPYAFSVDTTGETSFEFEFITQGIRYRYGFSCTSESISEEHLVRYATKRPAIVFQRNRQDYSFHSNATRAELAPLTERNTPNKLFLATAASWNSAAVREPFLWLRNSMDVFDSDKPMLQSLDMYADDGSGELKEFTNGLLRESDINISDFTIEVRDAKGSASFLPFMDIPAGTREYRVMATHLISDGDGKTLRYSLPLNSESKGTRNLFLLGPWIKKALDNGYTFCVDELDSSMHPALLLHLVSLFDSEKTNPHGAQLIMTSHTTDLLTTSLLRRDQVLFVEKDSRTGESELYSLADFSTRTREDIRKAYLAGRFGAVPNIL